MSTDNPTAAMPDADALRDALRSVMDPEAGMNIVDLGLVYGIDITGNTVQVRMTMTSPACPLGDMITDEARAALKPLLPERVVLDIVLVWTPPWDPSMMSDTARRHFNW